MCILPCCRIRAVVLLVVIAGTSSAPLSAQSPTYNIAEITSSSSPDSPTPRSADSLQPIIKPGQEASEQQRGVDWGHLVGQSLFFMSVEQAFRCSREEGTRNAFSTPFFQGYFNSVGNLHGWNDGDPFYVNYIGHTMQGAVSGYIWRHNDRAFSNIEFGKNRKYWKGQLRSGAYSFLYSALFEIGPVSEATIGNTQAYYPEQGFVDFVVTPVVGMGWSIGEDAVDQYLIRYIEAHTANPWLRLLARGGLNPARSMANVMAFRAPWHRDNRPGVRSYRPEDVDFMMALRERNSGFTAPVPPPGVAPFEFEMGTQFRTYLGNHHFGSCAGGGGSAALRLEPEWQFVVDISGCKLLGLEKNLSGDSLSYLAGLRWTPNGRGHWTPHVQVLIGGTKLTQELDDPELAQRIARTVKQPSQLLPLHGLHSKHWETNGFAIQFGGGVNLKLNHALTMHVASLDYSHSWTNSLNGINYQDGLQFSTGLTIQMGTW